MVDVVSASAGERIEERKDLGTGDAGVYAYWMAQESVAAKEERDWSKRARDIVKRYRDERGEALNNSHRFNVLWSNGQTLKPTLYARTPKPDVDRRFKDQAPVARLAAQLLERCLSYSCAAFDFDAVMKAIVEDRLLPGRGVARVLYVPHFGEKIASGEEQGEAEQAQPAEGTDEYAEREEEGTDVTSEGDAEDEGKAEREVEYEE